MAPQIEWIHQLPDILTAISQTQAASFDRSAIQALFGLSPRQAIRVMNRLGAERRGGALVISREELRRKLEQLLKDDSVQFEQRRRDRLEQQLERARKEARARRIILLRNEPEPGEGPRSLPAEVELGAGKLTVGFTTPIELMQKLMQIAQLAAEDWEGFEQRIQSCTLLMRTGR